MAKEKTGGRIAGTPNKATQEIKAWVKQLLETNQEQFESDMLAVEPKDRLQIMTSLLKYAVPTLSSISVESEIELEYRQLELLLNSAPMEAIEAITERILTLKIKTDERTN
jgi:hypothetical protein